MTCKEIPLEWQFNCDGCGVSVRQRHRGTPPGWVTIEGNQVSWSHLNNFHGLKAHACSRDCALAVMTKLCQGERLPFEPGEDDATENAATD